VRPCGSCLRRRSATTDLYLDVPGGEDGLVEPGETVTIENGMHFFTVPKTINPGA
jgi:hypothetical protein